MRIKRAVNAQKKRRAIIKRASGYVGASSRCYRAAKEAVARAARYSYIGRKLRKRDFRALWITRINAACRLNEISYSKFMFGLKKANVTLNRKMLAELAVNDAKAFSDLVILAKKA